MRRDRYVRLVDDNVLHRWFLPIASPPDRAASTVTVLDITLIPGRAILDGMTSEPVTDGVATFTGLSALAKGMFKLNATRTATAKKVSPKSYKITAG